MGSSKEVSTKSKSKSTRSLKVTKPVTGLVLGTASRHKLRI